MLHLRGENAGFAFIIAEAQFGWSRIGIVDGRGETAWPEGLVTIFSHHRGWCLLTEAPLQIEAPGQGILAK